MMTSGVLILSVMADGTGVAVSEGVVEAVDVVWSEVVVVTVVFCAKTLESRPRRTATSVMIVQ
jgi:steroid 5-alpha reductase family enzyme